MFGGAASRPEQFEFLRPLVSARRDRACRRAHPPVLSHRRWANAKLHVLIPEEILGVGTAWWALPAPREAWTASHSKFCFHLVDPLSRSCLVVGFDSVVRSSQVKSRPRCCSAQGRRRPLPRVLLERGGCVEAGLRLHHPRVHRARGRGRRRGPGSPLSSLSFAGPCADRIRVLMLCKSVQDPRRRRFAVRRTPPSGFPVFRPASCRGAQRWSSAGPTG